MLRIHTAQIDSVRRYLFRRASLLRVSNLQPKKCGSHHYSRARRRRKALPITDTELKLIAAAAIIGLSRTPKKG